MHILITAAPDDLARIFQYCDQYDIPLSYGQIDHQLYDVAWQIDSPGNSHIDILLLLFPHCLHVLTAGL